MVKRSRSMFVLMLFPALAIAAATAIQSPVLAESKDEVEATNPYMSRVDVNTNNRYSNSSSQYRLYQAPDGSYVSKTSVSVGYPGGSSNTDVQVVVPKEAWAAWVNHLRERSAYWRSFYSPTNRPNER